MPKLHHKIFGDTGDSLIILHGLFGSLENWSSQAKALSDQFRVVSVDLRNHGRSAHTADMGYSDMAEDIIQLMDALELESTHVIGHSMGGKTAMQLALNHPARVGKLIVVDIAPRQYPPHHSEIFDALESIDLPTLESRNAADAQIAPAVPETAVRSFLLKNLQRGNAGFEWKMNLAVLRQDYDSIAAAINGSSPFEGETLFVKGGASDYIQTNDKADIDALFSNARAKIIQSAGHWPHVEKAEVFTKIARDFLNGN